VQLYPLKGQPGARGQAMMQAMMDQGLLLRVVGDTINFSPPLIITEAEIDEMMRRFMAALETLPREAA